MKKLILIVLFVVTIPIPQWAQSEVPVDTMHVQMMKEYTYVWKDGYWQHSAPLFFEDPVWCGGKVVAWGNTVILEIKPGGDLWYLPSAFCRCLICKPKNKLIYWGNINGKRN